MKKAKTACGVAILCLVILLVAFLFHKQKSDAFTVEQHIDRISETVKKNYLKKDSFYSSYRVKPLYDENDVFADYCIVEFEPYGYLYVKIWDTSCFTRLLGGNSMYSRCEENTADLWERYRIVSHYEASSFYDAGILWQADNHQKGIYRETSDNGETKEHKKSHFIEGEVSSEKYYFLAVDGGYVPAVKRDDRFLNLISMELFSYSSNLTSEDVPCYRKFPLPKKICDL